MSFEEKSAWVSTIVTIVVLSVYSFFIIGQLQSVPVSEIAYQKPMLLTIGSMVVMSIIGMILMSIGTAITSEITGNKSIKDIDRKDERDKYIYRRGDQVGYYVTSAGAIGVLALAMLRYDPFWIANALYLSLALGGLVSLIARLVAYRRGF